MSENKMIKAYDDLMNHLYQAMDDSLHSVADALDIAKEKTVGLGVHTQDEINKVADHLMRDLSHAAHKMLDKKLESFSHWLKFDIKLLENFGMEAFLDLADKTRIKLAALEMDAKQYHPYRSGDITSPGTFQCENCGKHISFKSTSVIPDCPACQGKSFSRV
jgi:RNA polymerase-binding transcription factor DksA